MQKIIKKHMKKKKKQYKSQCTFETNGPTLNNRLVATSQTYNPVNTSTVSSTILNTVFCLNSSN